MVQPVGHRCPADASTRSIMQACSCGQSILGERPEDLMRVDLLADLPPLRPMDVAHAAGPHSFAAAAAAAGPPGHGWRSPPLRQPGAAHGSQPRRSRRGRPVQGPAQAPAPPPPVTSAASAPLLPALPPPEAPTPGARRLCIVGQPQGRLQGQLQGQSQEPPQGRPQGKPQGQS